MGMISVVTVVETLARYLHPDRRLTRALIVIHERGPLDDQPHSARSGKSCGVVLVFSNLCLQSNSPPDDAFNLLKSAAQSPVTCRGYIFRFSCSLN